MDNYRGRIALAILHLLDQQSRLQYLDSQGFIQDDDIWLELTPDARGNFRRFLKQPAQGTKTAGIPFPGTVLLPQGA